MTEDKSAATLAKDMPRRMYVYFSSYDEAGAPSFSKFARSVGLTLSELEALREHAEFDRAYRECNEIRRDYLIEGALTRRYDPSFVKFLLTLEDGGADGEEDSSLSVKVEVV